MTQKTEQVKQISKIKAQEKFARMELQTLQSQVNLKTLQYEQLMRQRLLLERALFSDTELKPKLPRDFYNLPGSRPKPKNRQTKPIESFESQIKKLSMEKLSQLED